MPWAREIKWKGGCVKNNNKKKHQEKHNNPKKRRKEAAMSQGADWFLSAATRTVTCGESLSRLMLRLPLRFDPTAVR